MKQPAQCFHLLTVPRHVRASAIAVHLTSSIIGLCLGLGCTGELASELGSESGNSAGSPGALEGVPNSPGTDALSENPISPEVPPSSGAVDPGRVSMRRLTPVEYENTVRDLLGIETTGLSQRLPADGGLGGFDNNWQWLGVAPNQLEVFQTTAAELAQQAVAPGAPARTTFFTCAELQDAECQRQILSQFASQAWRRPTSPEEIEQLLQLSSQGETPEQGLELAFAGVLTSPLFLFRIEFDPDPTSPQPHPVGQYELASRLSYFLWSSMPDQQLFDLASQGLLHDEQQLRSEVTRMLADPKAAAMTSNFADQWLGTRKLAVHAVDAEQFPEYDATLRDSMSHQTSELFSRVLHSGLPLRELLGANEGSIDEALREFYGLDGVRDMNGMMDLSSTPRADLGLLGHASILTLTSYPTRTSVVRRGLWVLENLLCVHPPPPPADVDTELGDPLDGTVRQRLEEHRANPACAGCHQMMDPIGLGLENFDALGRYRETENGERIDPSGELLGQGTFLGPQELVQLVAADPRFPSCATDKLMTFALGRETVESDTPYLDQIAADAGAEPTLTSLVMGVATSDPFLMRRGEN